MREKQRAAVSFFRLENCIYMQKSIVKEALEWKFIEIII